MAGGTCPRPEEKMHLGQACFLLPLTVSLRKAWKGLSSETWVVHGHRLVGARIAACFPPGGRGKVKTG